MASHVVDTSANTARRPLLSEDWAAVVIGFAMLSVLLLGVYRPSLPALKWSDGTSLSRVLEFGQSGPWLIAGAVIWAFALPGILAQRQSAARFTMGFPVVFLLAWLAQLLAGNALASAWGIEYVIFGLLLGLTLSNTMRLPAWLLEAARTEFYVKTGLVLMGATILFQEILQAGLLGLIQSVLVVVVVWYACFRFAKWMKLDDEWGAMLSTAVSICGVSAAIAACGAIQGDRRKLGYVTSVVLIVAVPMIVLEPWIARWLQLPDAVAGAWLGGTLDTTGSVVAAGALVSEAAMKVGTIVKFSQNVLIGVAAFALSVWWTMRSSKSEAERPGAGVIWERFPKFVLGFLAASLLFSFALDPELVRQCKSAVGNLRTMWFALGFVSIGLETRVGDLLRYESGRPFYAFLGGQAFNLAWTFLLAWLVFGGWFS
jgi:uncharacterized integral membrane protein (TIGR00698 family)